MSANSLASAFVNPTSAALDVAYATSPGSATISPVTELVTTIAPPPFAIMLGITAFATFHAPLTLISRCKSLFSNVSSSRKSSRTHTPALHTSTSIFPYVFSAVSTILSTLL